MKINNKGFSTIEVLFIIVLVSCILISGLAFVFICTKNAEIKTFKETAETIVESAKNSYNTLKKQNKTQYIITNADNTYEGMCITLAGLYKNGFYSKELTDWDGYVVIEENNGNINYSLWLTNKKFVISGYDSEKIKDLTAKNGIANYKDENFSAKVTDSFTGVKSNTPYNTQCISNKIV